MRILRLSVATAVLATSLLLGTSGGVQAACIVNNGANNGTDSQAEFGLVGFPGSDNGPAADQGTWAPANFTHDNWLKEWCEPSHDWVHDNEIAWFGANWDKIQANKASRKLAEDININDETHYNWTGNASSTLPWTDFYVADPLEQALQDYEEISFLIGDVSRIGKGVFYNTRSQWDQEKAVLGWIDSKAQWTDILFFGVNWDIIGRIDDKKFQQ